MNIILGSGIVQGRAPAVVNDGQADGGRRPKRLTGTATGPSDNTCLTPAEPHVFMRAVLSIGAFFSIVVAAYAASNKYRQLAKLPRAELERRGIPRGDLITDVSRMLLERK